MNKQLLIIASLLVALAISVFFNFNFLLRIRELESGPSPDFPDVPPIADQVTSFEECVAAGYPVMESYPERCATPDGQSFTRDVSGNPPAQP